MLKASFRLLLLPALLALPSAGALAQSWSGQDYGYRHYGYPSYGYPAPVYRMQAPPVEAAPEPYAGQPAPPEAYQPPAYQPMPEPVQPAPPPAVAAEPRVAPAAPAAAALPRAVPPTAAPPVQAAVPVAPPFVAASFVRDANQPVLPEALKRGVKQAFPAVARLQILLDRSHVSPGVIDGVVGSNLSKAVSALQNMNGLPQTGKMGPDVDAILAAHGNGPVFVPYVITDKDAAGPFVPVMPKDYAEMAKLPALAYRNVPEELAERFHMDEDFLRRLNPGSHFAAGETITVADVGPPAKTKVFHIIADSASRQVLGYDAQWNLVVAYPATIGSTDMPSPTGTHAVKAIAINPVYWYRPKVNFQQGKNDKPLKLAPGPNNPVGAVWIGLDKPTYGIHGTPEPSRIDKTNSHGCLRLTNWDAFELAHLVKPGVVVEFVDPTRTASIAPDVVPVPAPARATPQPMPPRAP